MSGQERHETPDDDALPHALTFFLSAGERRAVLETLRRHDHDRRRALLLALRRPAGPHARSAAIDAPDPHSEEEHLRARMNAIPLDEIALDPEH